MGGFELPFELIAEIGRMVSEFDVEEIEVRIGGIRIKALKGGPTSAAKEVSRKGGTEGHPGGMYEEVVSPMEGTFYRAPSPDSPPFVEEGDIVEEGATLCILESMKLMNELKAQKRCRIVKILKGNGQLVHSGDPIFLIEPVR